MRHISKGAPPPLLIAHAKDRTRVPNWTNCDAETQRAVRDSLLREQANLCAYCTRRVTRGHLRVEHWAPQSIHPDLSIAWKNLLGVCSGSTIDNARAPVSIIHCDNSKGNQTISLSPLRRRDIATVSFELASGRVVSSKDSFQKDIDVTLNLNCQPLCRARQQSARGVVEGMCAVLGEGAWSHAKLSALRSKVCGADREGKLAEYWGLLAQILDRKLAKLKRRSTLPPAVPRRRRRR